MAGLVERLTMIIHADASGAISEFKKVGNAADKELGKASTGVQKVGGHMMALGATAAVAGGGLLAYAVNATNSFQALGEQVMVLKRITGGTAEDASVLRFALHEVGISAEDGAKMLGKFSKSIMASKDPMKDFGINARDSNGQMVPMSELLIRLSAVYSQMPDGVEKSAMALKGFGRNGLAMIKLLNQGPEKIKAMTEEAQKMGVVLSGSNLDAVQGSLDAHRKFQAVMDGIQITIGTKVLPVLTGMTDLMATLLGNMGGVIGPLVVFGGAALVAAGAIAIMVGKLTVLIPELWATLAGEEALTLGSVNLGMALTGIGTALAAGIIAWQVYSGWVRDSENATEKVLAPQKVKEASMSYENLKSSLEDTLSSIKALRKEKDGLFAAASGSGSPMDFLKTPWNVAKVPGQDALLQGQIAAQEKHAAGLKKSTDAMEGLASATGIGTTAATAFIEEQAKNGIVFESTAGAVGAYTGVLDKSTMSTDEYTKAVKSQNQALKTYDADLKGLMDPIFAVNTAMERNATAGIAVSAAIAKYGVYSKEAKTATEAHTKSAMDLDIALQTLTTGVSTGAVKMEDFRAKLDQWVASGTLTRGEADLMIQKTQELIDKVNQVPPERRVAVVADTSQAMTAISDVFNFMARPPPALNFRIDTGMGLGTLPGRAIGGPVTAGQAYIVGESHPGGKGELFVPNQSGTIIPHDKMAAMGGASGGNTFNFYFPQYVGSQGELMAAIREAARAIA